MSYLWSSSPPFLSMFEGISYSPVAMYSKLPSYWHSHRKRLQQLNKTSFIKIIEDMICAFRLVSNQLNLKLTSTPSLFFISSQKFLFHFSGSKDLFRYHELLHLWKLFSNNLMMKTTSLACLFISPATILYRRAKWRGLKGGGEMSRMRNNTISSFLSCKKFYCSSLPCLATSSILNHAADLLFVV